MSSQDGVVIDLYLVLDTILCKYTDNHILYHLSYLISLVYCSVVVGRSGDIVLQRLSLFHIINHIVLAARPLGCISIP